MDSTPIYTELQQKLIDPEADSWGPSEPPEFAASLSEHAEHTEHAEPAQRSQPEAKKSPRKGSSRGGGRRHRAED